MKRVIYVLLAVLTLGIMGLGCLPQLDNDAHPSGISMILINQQNQRNESNRMMELLDIHIQKLDADMMNTRYLLQNEIQHIKSTESFPTFGFKPRKILVYISSVDVSTSAEFNTAQEAIEFLSKYKEEN